AEALTAWRKILIDHPDFADDSMIQEDGYEAQLNYLELAQEARGRRLKPLLILQDYLAQAATRPPGIPLWLPSILIHRSTPVPFLGPLDGLDKRGRPLIPPDARMRVRQR